MRKPNHLFTTTLHIFWYSFIFFDYSYELINVEDKEKKHN